MNKSQPFSWARILLNQSLKKTPKPTFPFFRESSTCRCFALSQKPKSSFPRKAHCSTASTRAAEDLLAVVEEERQREREHWKRTVLDTKDIDEEDNEDYVGMMSSTVKLEKEKLKNDGDLSSYEEDTDSDGDEDDKKFSILRKTSKNHIDSFRHYYYSSELNPLYRQILILNSTTERENYLPSGFICNRSVSYIPSGSDLDQTHVSVKDISNTPGANIDNVAEVAEKICKILSNNSANPRVESFLNDNVAGIEMSNELVSGALKKLSNSGVLALLFFRWAEKRDGFQYTTESYNSLIEALGKIKQFKKVWELVNDMKLKGLLNKDTFALISRRYARARKVKEAVETFEKMEKFGLKPELSDFNRLIDTISKSRNVERAQHVFDQMTERRFKPDIKSYTILLEGWGQEQNLLRLNEIYREMKDEGFEPDVVTYGIMINAYCKARKYDDALELFNQMEASNIKPNPHIFCTLIIGLGSAKRLNEALNFYRQSKVSGFSPEIPTYNALVGAYCWSMRMDDAYKVLDEMRQSGVGPNSRTYDIVLHHLIKSRKTKEAFSLFQRMSQDSNCEPTVSTYEIIIRMFCNEDRVDMAIRVWNQMKAKGVLPGMHMFSTLINSLCLENKLDDACNFFLEMMDLGIRPPAQLFSNLKQALLDEGREDKIQTLVEKIENLRKSSLGG